MNVILAKDRDVMILPKQKILVYLLSIQCAFGLGCSFKSAPSDAELTEIFLENRANLESLVMFCQNVPEARWIGLENYDFYRYKEETDLISDFEQEITTARAIMRELEIASFTCNRNLSLPKAPLMATRIPLFSKGLSIGGESKGFEFLTEHSIYTEERVSTGKIKLVDEAGWYIYTRID